mgnify:CR=1 FL=1
MIINSKFDKIHFAEILDKIVERVGDGEIVQLKIEYRNDHYFANARIKDSSGEFFEINMKATGGKEKK